VRLAAIAVLVSASAWAGDRPRVAVMGLVANDTQSQAVAGTLEETVSHELGRLERFEIVSRNDLAAMLGIERQRQLLGCSNDSSSCFSELAGALGAPFVIAGQLTKVGASMKLDLKMIDNRRLAVIARESVTEAKPESLIGDVEPMVRRLADAAVPVRAPTAAWIMTGAGAAVLATGAALVAIEATHTSALQAQLDMHTVQATEAAAQRDAIFTQRYVGFALLGVGGAAAVAGLVWAAVGQQPVSAAVGVVPGGAAVSLRGEW
jgi:TolB-like protein